MDDVRIGIIGVGQIGKNHLKRYVDIPGLTVVAAADLDEAELTRVADEYGIEHRYSDFRTLLERDDIVAVDVCLHNNLHAPVTIAAINADKHVYCEKPIAGSYRDALSMVEAARSSNKMLHIQLATLYTMETKTAKHLIDSGAVGRLYHGRSTGFRRRGRPFVDGYGTANFVKKKVAAGGALFDMGVYHIAQILYLLGVPNIERVSGKIYQELAMDPERRASSGYDVEEFATGFVRCTDGLTIDIIEAWAVNLNQFEGSSVMGSEGGIRLDPFSFHSTFKDLEMNSTFELGAIDTRWHRTKPNIDAYDSSQHHWVAALQGRVPLLPTAEIALRTSLISEGIYLSDRESREVAVNEVAEQSVSTAIEL